MTKTTTKARLPRTGLRKPTHYLKTWGDPDWTKRLTPRLRVGMVDEELPVINPRQPVRRRKSWYLSLTQDPDLATTLGPVRGLPKEGKTLLLFEDDVVALVRYLLESGLIGWDREGKPVNDAP